MQLGLDITVCLELLELRSCKPCALTGELAEARVDAAAQWQRGTGEPTSPLPTGSPPGIRGGPDGKHARPPQKHVPVARVLRGNGGW